MHTTVARPIRSSLTLLVLAATLTLVACASAAAQSPTSASNPTDPSGPSATPPGTGTTDPGAGNGSQPGNPGDPNGPITGVPGPLDPVPGDGALHVVPVPGVKDAHPVAIDHISIGPDGLTLTVYWWGGVESCYALSSATATRGADGVLVITVLEGTNPGLPPMTACIEIAQLKATTITLDQPIFRDGSQPQGL